MREALFLLAGVAIGAVAMRALVEPSDCCKRVAAGVRAEVQSQLGDTAVAVGDLFGIWGATPGLLTTFGVPL